MRLQKLLDWRKALIYTHRWLGIVGTTVFVIWFVSGIVFVYVGMPTLPAEERLQRMEVLDLSRLRVTPGEAAQSAGFTSPARVRIAMLDGRPVYRLQEGSDWRMVFGDTGKLFQGFTTEQALAAMKRYAPEYASSLAYDTRLTDSDQWTLQSIIRNQMPLHRITMGDAAGTEYYVSDESGEPVLETTASGRFWGYMSAVLHWLYFTPLRRNAAFWNSFVVWTSLIGTVVCGMGIVLGIWRYSLAGRFRLRGAPAHSPYASWMKWHHYAGLLFGFFACTWAFSGALSLSPFQFLKSSAQTREQRDAAAGGPIDLTPLTVERLQRVRAEIGKTFQPRELDFFQFQGEPYFVAYVPPGAGEQAPWRNTDISAGTSLTIDRRHVLMSALRPEAGPFTEFPRERMWDVAKAAMPGVPMQDAAWLTEYDAYYYSQEGTRPLPVLRVRYADANATWLYLDPHHGTIASRLERSSRLNRWLYKGFHDLDFPFLYYRRPLWDLVVIVLSLGGIALSVTSALPAWRRLVRHGRAIGVRGRRAEGPRETLRGSGARAGADS